MLSQYTPLHTANLAKYITQVIQLFNNIKISNHLLPLFYIVIHAAIFYSKYIKYMYNM